MDIRDEIAAAQRLYAWKKLCWWMACGWFFTAVALGSALLEACK